MPKIDTKRNRSKIIDNLRWLGRISGKQKHLLYLPFAVLLGVCQSLLMTALPSIILFFLNEKLELASTFTLIIFLSFMSGLFLWFNSLLSTKVFWDSIKTRMKLQVIDGRGFVHMPYFDLISAKVQSERVESANYGYANDDSGVGRLIPSLITLLQSILLLIIIGVISIDVAVWVPLLVLLTCFLSFVILSYFSSQRARLQSGLSQVYLEQNYLYKESFDISAAQEIRIYALNSIFREKIKKCESKIETVKMRIAQNTFHAQILLLFVNLARSVPIYLFLVYKTLNGELSIVSFTFLFSLLGMLDIYIKEGNSGLENFLNANGDITKCRVYFDKIEKYTSGRNAALDSALPAFNSKHFCLELKNVTVNYPSNNHLILKNINLKINSGDHLALVGLNGAGKTTLTLVMMGFIKPTSGEVLLNGTDINKLSLKSYQKIFTPAFQDNVLLADTIEKNITVGKPTDAKVLTSVIHKANLNSMIQKLENSEKTPLTRYMNDNGVIPSGGELQKIVLARVLYRDTLFTILDEPTAALDALTESKLYQQMKELFDDKISVFISHRLASTKFADKVIFLKKGKIIASGTHQDLLNECDDYRELFNIQKRYYESSENDE